MLHSEHTSAAELSHTNFVDSLKFSTTKLTQGQTTSVRVEFSSKDNLKVKAGDTITFTLPAELQGMTVTLRSLTANFKSCKILITLLAKIGPKPLSKSTIIIEPSGLRVAACDHAP